MLALEMADTGFKESSPVATHVESDEKIPEKVLVESAAVGSEVEHELTPWNAIKAYPAAVGWCLVVSMCVVMVSQFST